MIRDISISKANLKYFYKKCIFSVLNFLKSQSETETLDLSAPSHFNHASNLQDIHFAYNAIVGSNKVAVNSAVEHATSLGYITYVLSISLDGVARDQGVMLARYANTI